MVAFLLYNFLQVIILCLIITKTFKQIHNFYRILYGYWKVIYYMQKWTDTHMCMACTLVPVCVRGWLVCHLAGLWNPAWALVQGSSGNACISRGQALGFGFAWGLTTSVPVLFPASASWLPWTKHLSSPGHICHEVSVSEPANHGLNPLKAGTRWNLCVANILF